ncbi:hypothetical protein E2C01_051309 [Portunus trituberculatus]|uniref:Uncharacterized protein n=1 Tax=Portunus trituberculatus TaxID=210409 RepID=A0A5B7GB88_PORTR|nr:hypothetical protein [Portunus trituberculatus]
MTVQAFPVCRILHRRAQEGRIHEERENVTITKGLDHPFAGPDVLPLLPVPLQTRPNLQRHLRRVPSESPNGPYNSHGRFLKSERNHSL